MKIMFYENTSGFAHYTHELCNAVAKQLDTEEIIYVSNNSNKYIGRLNENVKGLPILKSFSKEFKKNTVQWVCERVGVSLSNILRRNKLVKEVKPDIISIQSTVPIIDQYFLRVLKKYTKVVLTAHDVIVPQKSKSWSKSSLKRIYNIADQIIVHSETNKNQLCGLYGIDANKVVVIHHGVHTEFNKFDVRECKKAIGVENGKKTVLFYGGIRESKGLDILIKALKGVECNLVIAGAMPFGESFDKYEQLIQENMIDCRKYIEYTTDEFAEILFQASDLVALPYVFFYSQSGVFMKALQYRKPIVATDVSCFNEYIERYQIGNVCKAEDIKGLQLTLNNLIKNEEKLRVYEHNTEWAVQENSWSKSAELHIKLFNDIHNNHYRYEDR